MRVWARLGALALALAACSAPKELTADECACGQGADPRNAGAVVVRWRIIDTQVGRLFGRGQCCCSPRDLDPASPAAKSCSDTGARCPESPAWLLDTVRLVVRPRSPGAGVGGRPDPCFISTSCQDAELTTGFCLAAGEYDLQLIAPRAMLDPPEGALASFVFSGAQARSPLSVRRTVRPGQIVNLDAVLLGVNEPPPAPDLQ